MKPPPNDGTVRVGCERRRAGTMTTIFGLHSADLETVAKELKRRCGTGGTAKDGVVELQGDRRDAALAYLAERGIRAKRMGG
jgi:translation initiation factor 1